MKQSDGMFEHVRFEEARDPIESQILADAAVDGERHVESLGFVIDFMKHRRAVQRGSVVGYGRQQAGGESQLLHAAAQLGGGGFGILRREQGDAFKPRGLAREAVIEPVVVALRDRRRPGR